MPVACQAETIKVFAAGSTRVAIANLQALAKTVLGDVQIEPTFGSSGSLRQKIEGGAEADLFFSADTRSPDMLYAEKRALQPPVPFARNRMCAYGPPATFAGGKPLLDVLLEPAKRIVTSTPVVDPAGDYAAQIFERADKVKPGSTKILTSKVQHLLGGGYRPLEGHGALASLFLRKEADVVIVYCSGAANLKREMPDIVSVPVPDALEPRPVLGLAILSRKPAALQFALLALSAPGQAAIAKAGVLPLQSAP